MLWPKMNESDVRFWMLRNVLIVQFNLSLINITTTATTTNNNKTKNKTKQNKIWNSEINQLFKDLKKQTLCKWAITIC